MANVNHATLTDPNLHEPKGVAAAPAGQVYISDGAGSGDWKELEYYVNGYLPFDATTPAYQHSVTTSFTPLNPTFSISSNNGFTGQSSPNARLRYDGVETITATAQFTIAFKNNSGSNRDIEIQIRKNGTTFNGGHTIDTAISGQWKSMTMVDIGSLSTNDYLEVFIKGSAAFTLDLASASLTVTGVPV
jgi:hypothetical protein